MHDATPRTAVVADARPLERNFLRFLLEEEGIAVRAEAGTLADLLLALQREPPTAVVLHERMALDRDPAAIAQIRSLAPKATVVVVTARGEEPSAPLRAIADTTVADGVGLAALGLAVARPREEVGPAHLPPVEEEIIADAGGRDRGWWIARLQGAVAASIVALAVIALRNGGPVLNRAGEAPSETASPGAGPTAPGGPSTGPDGDADGDETVGGPGALAGVLLGVVPPSDVQSDEGAPAPQPSEGSDEASSPGPIPPAPETEPPSGTLDAPSLDRGPPSAVFGRLKPKPQAALTRALAKDVPPSGNGGESAGGPPGEASDGPGRGNGGRPAGWVEHANEHAHDHGPPGSNGNHGGQGKGNH
jgi:CheY-like chemotaxis protein